MEVVQGVPLDVHAHTDAHDAQVVGQYRVQSLPEYQWREECQRRDGRGSQRRHAVRLAGSFAPCDDDTTCSAALGASARPSGGAARSR